VSEKAIRAEASGYFSGSLHGIAARLPCGFGLRRLESLRLRPGCDGAGKPGYYR
jgi:hypothetical protein